jgi:hypothetical protein
LVNRETLADINPTFEGDAHIVQMPPEQSAFSNGEKIIERDVEVYRKKAQSICMHPGIRSANVVSDNAQLSATIKEEQAVCRMFDHRQSNPYVAARALVRDAAPTISLCNRLGNQEPKLKLNGQF